MIIYVRILSVGDLGFYILLSGSKAPLTVLDELRVINSTFGLVLLDSHGMALLRHSLAYNWVLIVSLNQKNLVFSALYQTLFVIVRVLFEDNL